MPNFFLVRCCTAASCSCGSEMLIDAMRIVASETNFTIINHAFGFTALREDKDRHLLFCLSTGEWSIYDSGTAQFSLQWLRPWLVPRRGSSVFRFALRGR